jgi:predicted nucleic acid-binding protein
MIGLRDVGQLSLLQKVAQTLNWSLFIPEAAYCECTFKPEKSVEIANLVASHTVQKCQPPDDVLNEFNNRYLGLGKGETAALAYAFTCQQKDDPAIVITSDHRPRKIAEKLGIQTITVLDFFKKANDLKLLSKQEVLALIPLLKRYMWLSEQAVDTFRDSIINV